MKAEDGSGFAGGNAELGQPVLVGLSEVIDGNSNVCVMTASSWVTPPHSRTSALYALVSGVRESLALKKTAGVAKFRTRAFATHSHAGDVTSTW